MRPQKAKHLYLEMEKKNPDCLYDDYMVLEKHDGWYGYLDDGQPVMSRNMRAIPSLKRFSEELNDLRFARHGRMIFEIMVEGMPVFKDLNGYLNRSVGDCEAVKAYLRVHDCIGDLREPFEERWLTASANMYSLNHDRVQRAIIRQPVSNHSHWQENAEDIWSTGGEGIIMKRLKAGYKPGARVADILKIKEDLTLEMLVVDWVYGKEGKYEDTLGALIVEEKDGTRHTVSGMTDAERDEWHNNPDIILGKVVEIKAMKRLANGSLREPRYKAIRYDKDAWEID